MTDTGYSKIEILLDAPLVPRVTEIARQAGIAGYTILPTLGGAGQGGEWSEDLVAGADTKVLFWTVVSRDKAAALRDAVAPLLTAYGMVWVATSADVLRQDRF
ncbi:MAG: P-II family nitrogen regulator [Mesorhizobium sp.]